MSGVTATFGHTTALTPREKQTCLARFSNSSFRRKSKARVRAAGLDLSVPSTRFAARAITAVVPAVWQRNLHHRTVKQQAQFEQVVRREMIGRHMIALQGMQSS